MRSASGYGTDLSRDIEDRVAKLEAGLQTFQRSLQRLTADRNRRTVLIGGVPQRRASTDVRTPSMLADTLQDPLGASGYQYDFTETQRPSTSPQPPRTPVRSTETVPPLPAVRHSDEPSRTPPPLPPVLTSCPREQGTGRNGGGNGNGNGNGLTQPYNFHNLYQMLDAERTARRHLERQLQGLQNEINSLHDKVSVVGSQGIQSQRSSYIAGPQTLGSNRLRDLLRETELSPPGTAQSNPPQQQRDSGATGFTQISEEPVVVSRFSGSDSEVGGVAESEDLSVQTPYEAYQTPREERGRFHFGDDGDSEGEGEGEMF